MRDELSNGRGERLRFTVQLRFVHPSMSAKSISDAFGCTPDRMWSSADARTTPTGLPLQGVRKETYWSYTETIYDKRAFFDEMMSQLDGFKKHTDFLTEFYATGGEAMIVVGLHGKTNIGDTLNADQLRKIAKMGFSVGIEVFPNLN
jgi:hypothetical protein